MPEIPQTGPLPGQLFLNPSIAPQVQGSARPLSPGEYLMNPNGSWSSEMTYTLQMPNGQWAVIPGMWIVNGVPTRVNEDQALQYAQQTGLNWQTYPSEDAAEAASEQRESKWQDLTPQTANTVPPLWNAPSTAPDPQSKTLPKSLNLNMPSVPGAKTKAVP